MTIESPLGAGLFDAMGVTVASAVGDGTDGASRAAPICCLGSVVSWRVSVFSANRLCAGRFVGVATDVVGGIGCLG
ncbi:hypothetical protein [Mycobacterium spongiae]|uniref:Uncharacterized protein n=1 Tax=Mycobacterium spongiae TaxID=886343 RepID=A0A975K0B3_9MYCO|nr:hypothetical protein [Mycobacterium spongiae]QUR69016.1 hypothetical protein F6B93_19825 [Mycobacterium spongiae]